MNSASMITWKSGAKRTKLKLVLDIGQLDAGQLEEVRNLSTSKASDPCNTYFLVQYSLDLAFVLASAAHICTKIGTIQKI